MVFTFIKKKQPPLSPTLKNIKRMLISKDAIVKRELSSRDLKFLKKIKEETKLLNKNNVTRTRAYLDFYKHHPEIHWAFLAHLVQEIAVGI